MSGSESVLMRLSRLRMERQRVRKVEVGDSGAKALQNHQFIAKLLDEADLKFIAARGGDSRKLQRERIVILNDFITDLETRTVDKTRHATQAGLLSAHEARALQRSIKATCGELRALATATKVASDRPERINVLLGAIDSYSYPSNVIVIA